jgi:hypothetical protein
VATDIEQVNREMIIIHPMMPKRIAAKMLARMKTPFALNAARERDREKRRDVVRGFRQLSGEPLLNGALAIQQAFFFQARINARAQQDRLERFGEIIRGSHLDALCDTRGLVRCGEHDDRQVAERTVGVCTAWRPRSRSSLAFARRAA